MCHTFLAHRPLCLCVLGTTGSTQLSEEKSGQAIMAIMELGSTHHKYIWFIQEKKGVEMLCKFEITFKL